MNLLIFDIFSKLKRGQHVAFCAVSVPEHQMRLQCPEPPHCLAREAARQQQRSSKE
jgi:hypothetical protein